MNDITPIEQPELTEEIGETTEVSWSPPASMDYESWYRIGATLQQINRSLGWWIGDWLNAGEQKYGETYAQAIEWTDHSVETLRKYKAVSERIKPENRRADLSWTHHLIVAYMDPEEQIELLELAANLELSTSELRDLILLKPEQRKKLFAEHIKDPFETRKEFSNAMITLQSNFVPKGTTKEQREELRRQAAETLDFRNEQDIPEELPEIPDAVTEFWWKQGLPIEFYGTNIVVWNGCQLKAVVDHIGKPYLVWEVTVDSEQSPD